jgi:DNA segregation ATPase FtsK/SpoIIIE, S-DNA-T family
MAKRSGSRRAAPGRNRKQPPRPLLTSEQRSWVVGLLLLAMSLLTFLSFLSVNRGILTESWLAILRLVFGWGIYVVPLALAVFGVWVITLGTGQPLTLPATRVIGALVLFLVALTMSHLFLAQPQMEAEAGHGGGFVGYWLSSGLISALGRAGSVVVLLALAVIGLTLLGQVSWTQAVASIAEWGRQAVAWIRGHWFSGSRPRTLRLPDDRSILIPEGRTMASPAMDGGSGTLANAAPAVPSPLSREGDVAIHVSPADSGKIVPWVLPRVEDILAQITETQMSLSDIREKARTIEDTLKSLGVPATVVEVNPGPVVTQFGLEPGYIERRERDGVVRRSKVKVSRIAALANDLALALAASPIRIEAPVPGKGIVGLEIPNSESAVVGLRGVMESEQFRAIPSKLALALGRDVSGMSVVDDLGKLPHILIAGATGSGKSVCINAFVASLLFRNTPDDLRLLMIDPKRVELSNYNGIPHLLAPVVVEVERVVGVLTWVTREMDRRYRVFAKVGARNLQAYNDLAALRGEDKMPLIVVFIDELADLMMVAPDEVERAICRIAQMARATGIHLVVATQRPSVDVVTGLIKANFPARLSFAVSSQVDSRVILDTPGAEKLLGRGDALYMAPDSPKLMRIQGCWVSDSELGRLVAFWKEQVPARDDARAPTAPTIGLEGPAKGAFVQQPLPGMPMTATEDEEAGDPLLKDAIALVGTEGRASVSFLQRRLRIGYTRAARLVDLLEAKGIIGPATGASRVREVLKPAENGAEAGDTTSSPAA